MKYKVLVAEDELIERKVLCKSLKKHLGDFCDIYESRNGREAIAIVEREHPQIAILDIEMPGVNGLDVSSRIRELGINCAIMFVTGFDSFAYAKHAITIRAVEYLLKPYKERELIDAVEAAMQSVSHQQSLPQRTEPVKQEPEKSEGSEYGRLHLIREEIQDYIEAHYMEDISMQSAAAAMCYAETYFSKLFKQCFQMNFSAYLNDFRIGKAKAMMVDPRLNVKDIGIACGYSDSNYFARVFKRITGQTPSEYRLTAAQDALYN